MRSVCLRRLNKKWWRSSWNNDPEGIRGRSARGCQSAIDHTIAEENKATKDEQLDDRSRSSRRRISLILWVQDLNDMVVLLNSTKASPQCCQITTDRMGKSFY